MEQKNFHPTKGRKFRDSHPISLGHHCPGLFKYIVLSRCIGRSREGLLVFSPPDSEMHFSTVSISAPTVRTRSHVFQVPTLFFIVSVDCFTISSFIDTVKPQ